MNLTMSPTVGILRAVHAGMVSKLFKLQENQILHCFIQSTGNLET